MELIQVDEARETALTALRRAGVPENHAKTQVSLLLEAELSGVPSHGLLRLPRLVRRIQNGVADPKTSGRQSWRGPSFLAVDGERGLGPVVALAAIESLVPRAAANGVCVAAISNSNHIGMLAWYAEQIALRGFCAVVLTTSEALVHPWGGYKPLIGTNPIAIGVPTADRPFVMDTATGVVSMGKIHDYAQRNEPIPVGWALDDQGDPTTNAELAKRGAISPMAEGKGYALGLGIELLVAALTGTALGTDVTGTLDEDTVCNKGDVIIIADPAAGVGASLSSYLATIRSTPPAVGFERVLVPGDRAAATRIRRSEDGLSLTNEMWAQLQALSGQPRGEL